MFIFDEVQDSAKVTLSKKKLNISITARANELIFFINDRGMFELYIHKDMPRETPC
jgi:hypothetical protein